MEFAQFFVSGALAVILLDLPSLHGRYILVEIDNTAAAVSAAEEPGKAVIRCNIFVYPSSLIQIIRTAKDPELKSLSLQKSFLSNKNHSRIIPENKNKYQHSSSST